MDNQFALTVAGVVLTAASGLLSLLLIVRGRARLVWPTVDRVVGVLSMLLSETNPPRLPSKPRVAHMIEVFAQINGLSPAAMPDADQVLWILWTRIQSSPFLPAWRRRQLAKAIEACIEGEPLEPTVHPISDSLGHPIVVGAFGSILVAGAVLLVVSLVPESFVRQMDAGVLWTVTVVAILVGLTALLSLLFGPRPPAGPSAQGPPLPPPNPLRRRVPPDNTPGDASD